MGEVNIVDPALDHVGRYVHVQIPCALKRCPGLIGNERSDFDA